LELAMILLLGAGAVILTAGLAAIGFGIPVQEFSFGNTLILAGTVGACTGAILIGLAVVVRELKDGMQRFGLSTSDAAANVPVERRPIREVAVNDGPGSDQFSATERPGIDALQIDGGAPVSPVAPPDIAEPVEPDTQEAAPAAKPRRNLLFAMSSRKERERAAAKSPDDDPVSDEPDTVPAPPPVSRPAAPPPSFDDAWPPSPRGRAEDPIARARAPSTFNAPNSGAAAPPRATPTRNAEQPPVTVLKSGIVDGMAYSLYSDGSIEAQMPEGMMRFASIDELRSHLDQRP
jgi:hypothetical protein